MRVSTSICPSVALVFVFPTTRDKDGMGGSTPKPPIVIGEITEEQTSIDMQFDHSLRP